MRKQLGTVKNSFGHFGSCFQSVYRLIRPSRTRSAPPLGTVLTSRWQILKSVLFCILIVIYFFCRVGYGRCGPRRGVVAVECKIPKVIHCACETRPEKFLTLSRLISAFERAYYHLPTRPEWRERAPGLSLRNSEVGAESARCVLVEFSAHFGASKSTFGAPLALLESENMRFIKV